MRLTSALATDVDSARKILAGKLGDIKVGERDDGVWALLHIGPVLQEAAGADLNLRRRDMRLGRICTRDIQPSGSSPWPR
jgi:hypothetical protein